MSSMIRYSTVLRYIQDSSELEIARLTGRRSSVAAEEVARLGDVAFAGPDGDVTQLIIDDMVRESAVLALGASPLTQEQRSHPAITAGMAQRAAALGSLEGPIKEYIDARTDFLVRQEKANGEDELTPVGTSVERDIAKSFLTEAKQIGAAT